MEGVQQRAQEALTTGRVLEGSLSAALSNTVCISDPSGEWFTLQSKIVKEFSGFGDIARMDLSLVVVLKCVLLTYFDVRSTQKVLLHMPGQTEPFPPAAHDCRIVRVKMTQFFSEQPMLAANGGFAQFGEVAHVAMAGGDAIVEYYDMRSAQMLLAAAGNSASPWMLPNRGNNSSVSLNGLSGLETLGAFMSNSSGAAPVAHALPATPNTPNATSAPPGLMMRQPGGKNAGGPADGEASPTANGQNNADAEALKAERGSRPVRTKVTTKEFSKYDVDPVKIQRCEDPRTTVMVRNLSGTSARKDFLRFLERCGLNDRYTFFYMPCKEHRNIPAGFAFVNFATPSDVHKLYVMVKSGFWREFMTDPMAKAPAMSYARFQGHEELAKHFNSSAVLHEQDPEKRPIFRLEVLKAIKEQQFVGKDEGTGHTNNLKAAPVRSKVPAMIPQPPVNVDHTPEGHSPASENHKPESSGADLQEALSKGAQEIAAILRRQKQAGGNSPSASPMKAGTKGMAETASEGEDSGSSQIASAGMGA